MSAQERGFSTKPGRTATFADNVFCDNWFVGVGAGANYVVGDNNADADFLNRLTVAPTIQVGKWYNPVIGGRLKYQGGSWHNFNNDANSMIHSKDVAGELDFLWNVSNYLGNYNENRFYSFIPYLGVGFGYGWDYKLHDKKYQG
ncbi:MAG: OmpA family protein, partial [Dysgonomonas sp.]